MPKAERAAQADKRQVLVAILNNQPDFAILQEQGWYRIPVASAPKRWPPGWLAFYQTKVFGDQAFAVNYWGRVREIRVVRRRELFPHEIPNLKSEREYYQVFLHSLERRAQPIRSARWRRIVFISTTWRKFSQAVEINDLFDDSPLEDALWKELKQRKIDAERQWDLKVGNARYFLDFAVFCVRGRLDVETDGDTWHADRKRIPEDNKRDNALQVAGWHVLRFNGPQIRESLAEYCVPQIAGAVTGLGGLSSEGLAPRVFYDVPGGVVEQLALFEEGGEYDLD